MKKHLPEIRSAKRPNSVIGATLGYFRYYETRRLRVGKRPAAIKPKTAGEISATRKDRRTPITHAFCRVFCLCSNWICGFFGSRGLNDIRTEVTG